MEAKPSVARGIRNRGRRASEWAGLARFCSNVDAVSEYEAVLEQSPTNQLA